MLFWREGTSWDGQSVYLDDDGLLTKDDRVALTEILQKDAHAVALNSYYAGQVTEDMTVLQIKSNKEARNYQEQVYFGLTVRQLVFSGLRCV